jgi:RNA polymerase primary sigma factor
VGSDESITLADLQEDYTYSPERNLMKKSSRAAAIHFMDRLKEREKRILMCRYQFNGGESHTLKNIGDTGWACCLQRRSGRSKSGPTQRK